jgi:transcriptional regulator with XRE-family HTH domain
MVSFMSETPKDTEPQGSRQRRVTKQNGPAIRALREISGWKSQEALATAVGIRQGTLSDIENEFADAKIPTLSRIARRLHVPLDAIMRGQFPEDAATADPGDDQDADEADTEAVPETAGVAA